MKILLLIWGSIISSAMAAGMLTDTSISSLLLAFNVRKLSSVSVLAILSPLGRLVERAGNISNNPLSQSLYTGAPMSLAK